MALGSEQLMHPLAITLRTLMELFYTTVIS